MDKLAIEALDIQIEDSKRRLENDHKRLNMMDMEKIELSKDIKFHNLWINRCENLRKEELKGGE